MMYSKRYEEQFVHEINITSLRLYNLYDIFYYYIDKI
jgi:hypothetical protein